MEGSDADLLAALFRGDRQVKERGEGTGMREQSVRGSRDGNSSQARHRDWTYDGDVLRGQHLYVSTVPFIDLRVRASREQSGVIVAGVQFSEYRFVESPNRGAWDVVEDNHGQPGMGTEREGNGVRTAAYGDDSSRSALTFMPPVTRAMVSRPDRSVTWTNVSLNEANWRRGES